MYIKSIELDGFKSYARRTEIKDFDPLFNAITGLNGSGKSNILDSICFLLGISQLNQVRATSLNDLVYKNGQAGITRATVSITFDNRDKDKSPIGYHDSDKIVVTRQINVNGKNKYMINGVHAQNNRVADFFQSVGMNINNPHFLIMQGRVTKVMNMKPMEILSMIEEATGTRMYESKKDSCTRAIEKKQLKYNELTKILNEDLHPQIQKLKGDRESYMRYQQLTRQIELSEKFVIAFKYHALDEKLQSADEGKAQLQAELQSAREEDNRLKEANAQAEESVKKMSEQNEAEEGSQMAENEAKLKHLRNTEAKKLGEKKAEQDKVKRHQQKVEKLKKTVKNTEQSIEAKETAREKMQNAHESNAAKAKQAEEEYNKATNMLEQLRVGTAVSADGSGKTMADEAIEKRQIVSNKETVLKTTSAKIKRNNTDINNLKRQMTKASSSYNADKKQRDKVVSELEKITAELNQGGFNEEEYARMSARHNHLETEYENLNDQQKSFYEHFNRLEDPLRLPQNFDRRKIIGFAGKLVRVQKKEFLPALEKTAGGKLYNLVVDTSETAQYIFKNKLLRRRVTLLPLDKLSVHRDVDPRKVQKAKSLVGGPNAESARNCVSVDDPSLDIVAQFLFNGIIVTNTNNMASSICYDRDIKTKTISNDGGVYDPSGSISGGGEKNFLILKELEKLRDIENKIETINEEYYALQDRLKEMDSFQAKFQKLNGKRAQMNAMLEQLNDKLQNSEFGRQQADIDALEAEVRDMQQVHDEAKEEYDMALKEAKEIETRMHNLEKNREQEEELKKMEKDCAVKKKKMDDELSRIEQANAGYESMGMEIAGLKEELAEAQAALQEASEESVDSQLQGFMDECNALKAEIEQMVAMIKDQRELIKARNSEITETRREIKENEKRIKHQAAEIQKCEHQIQVYDETNAAEVRLRDKLYEENEWIETDKSMFGKQGPYDFSNTNPQKAEKDLKRAKAMRDQLDGQINHRSMALLVQAEKQEQEVLAKRTDVVEELKQIEGSIMALDKSKKREITEAYQQVNRDFGRIFSTLLPGATAKLAPPEGKSVLEGLEFKVGFGNVWKDNLGELSGGQRSLVALSLILAMLLLKPAPIYILDEVDAALDLSHTQNIGTMLKQQFQKSQFVIVSLKDGMYENASVLFRTKFVDGVSTVARISSGGKKGGAAKKGKENNTLTA